MRKKYVVGTNKKVDAALCERVWDDPARGVFGSLSTAVSLARDGGLWLDPETLRVWCHTLLRAEALTGAEASRFRAVNVAQIRAETTALERAAALEAWAKAGDEDTRAREIEAEAEQRRALTRDEWAERRAYEMKDEEERAAHAKRVVKARKEWELANARAREEDGPHAA
jgi:hypothetical protein